jgi:hypothetical protein
MKNWDNYLWESKILKKKKIINGKEEGDGDEDGRKVWKGKWNGKRKRKR